MSNLFCNECGESFVFNFIFLIELKILLPIHFLHTVFIIIKTL